MLLHFLLPLCIHLTVENSREKFPKSCLKTGYSWEIAGNGRKQEKTGGTIWDVPVENPVDNVNNLMHICCNSRKYDE